MRPNIRFGPAFARSLNDMQAELGRLMEEAAAAFGPMGLGSIPVDVNETADGLVVEAELAGVSPEDLEVTIDGDMLHLAGTRRLSRKEQPKLSERRGGRVERSLRLPFAPEPDRVEARYEHGLLRLFAPRPDGLRGVRVNVSTGPSAAPS